MAVGLRIRHHCVRELCRFDGSFVRVIQVREQEPLLSRSIFPPRGMRGSGHEQPVSSRPLVPVGGRAVLERIYEGTVAGTGARVSQTARRSLPQHRAGIFRIVLPPGRHPHSQIHLPAAHPWRANGTRWFELRAVSVTPARRVSAALHSDLPRRWANIADPLAPRDRRERSTMEGTGQRGMKAGIACNLCSVLRVTRNEWDHSYKSNSMFRRTHGTTD